MSYTVIESEPILIDTNILVYAADSLEGNKHKIASEFISHRIKNDLPIAISTQNISELLSVATKKSAIENELRTKIRKLMDLSCVRIIAPLPANIFEAADHAKKNRMSFWDALITVTMFENNVFTICSEDRGFSNDKRISRIDPFAISRQ